ncbi:hypothetical protein KCU61_g730, partial [Aureobasidium melanogenum]
LRAEVNKLPSEAKDQAVKQAAAEWCLVQHFDRTCECIAVSWGRPMYSPVPAVVVPVAIIDIACGLEVAAGPLGGEFWPPDKVGELAPVRSSGSMRFWCRARCACVSASLAWRCSPALNMYVRGCLLFAPILEPAVRGADASPEVLGWREALAGGGLSSVVVEAAPLGRAGAAAAAGVAAGRRSRVSISTIAACQHGSSESTCRRTVTTSVQVDDTANTDVDNTEETLVLLLELLLVKYLNGENALFVCSPAGIRQFGKYGLSVFLMTPVVFVCSPLMVATAKGSGNPAGQRQLTLRSTSGQRRGTHGRRLSCKGHRRR